MTQFSIPDEAKSLNDKINRNSQLIQGGYEGGVSRVELIEQAFTRAKAAGAEEMREKAEAIAKKYAGRKSRRVLSRNGNTRITMRMKTGLEIAGKIHALLPTGGDHGDKA